MIGASGIAERVADGGAAQADSVMAISRPASILMGVFMGLASFAEQMLFVLGILVTAEIDRIAAKYVQFHAAVRAAGPRDFPSLRFTVSANFAKWQA